MIPMVILAALVLLPPILILLLRSHGSVAFMAVCLGSVLANYVAYDSADFISTFTPIDAVAGIGYVQLVWLVLPLILVLLAMKGSVSSGAMMMNFLPALTTGLLLALLALPLLPDEVRGPIESNELYAMLSGWQTAVILAGAAVSIFVLIVMNRSKKADKVKK